MQQQNMDLHYRLLVLLSLFASMYFGLQMPRLSSEHIRGDLYSKKYLKALGVCGLFCFIVYFDCVQLDLYSCHFFKER